MRKISSVAKLLIDIEGYSLKYRNFGYGYWKPKCYIPDELFEI
jgi:hypothetical protein